jgi:hypothetical protein
MEVGKAKIGAVAPKEEKKSVNFYIWAVLQKFRSQERKEYVINWLHKFEKIKRIGLKILPA